MVDEHQTNDRMSRKRGRAGGRHEAGGSVSGTDDQRKKMGDRVERVTCTGPVIGGGRTRISRTIQAAVTHSIQVTDICPKTSEGYRGQVSTRGRCCLPTVWRKYLEPHMTEQVLWFVWSLSLTSL